MSRSGQAVVAAGVWLALLTAALALSVAAAAYDTLPGDEGFTSWLQDQPFPGETLADAVRTITRTELLIGAGAAGGALLWARGYRAEGLALVGGMLLLALVQAGAKEIVDRPRPDPGLVDVRGSYVSESFPSGHTMGATYFYGFLIYVSFALPLASGARLALAAASALVLALSWLCNVWLGVHWPSDTLGGYLWGLTLLVPAIALCQWRRVRICT